MTNLTRKLIKAVISEDAVAFEQLFNAAIGSAVHDKISSRRREIARHLVTEEINTSMRTRY